jgi:hypothetical protein
MREMSGVGAVNIEHSHFRVGEMWEPGFELSEGKPDFQTERPVVAVPGQVVVTSRVQEHTAPVALAVSDREIDEPGPGWALVGSVDYQPVYSGRMGAMDTLNGPAGPADESVQAFGQQVEPGHPFVVLDTSRTYRAQVWSQGRGDSCERFDMGMPRNDGRTCDGFEMYVIVFVPSGTQEPPVAAIEESRRDRLIRKHGKPPLNMR